MKLLSILTFISFISLAQASCYVYEVQGEVQVSDNKMVIRLGEDSLSDVKLFIPISEQMKTLPMIDEWITARIVVNKEILSNTTEIIKVKKVGLAVRDPLNDVPQETRKFKGEESCE